MPLIELRRTAGTKSPDDIAVLVQDQTFDYLMTTSATEIRVSAYFDRDWPTIESAYAELFVNEDCPSRFKIAKVIPGSKVRRGVALPGAMKEGEQLTLQVIRSDAAPSAT
jgi:hypothetical protein